MGQISLNRYISPLGARQSNIGLLIYYPREYSTSILLVMSVPLTLLGLLERGPSHGYDLKRDYDAYFGRGRALRYSQVYATLSRLARDGKTVPGPIEQGAGPERRRTASPARPIR